MARSSDKFKMVAVYLPFYRFINSLEGNTLIALLQVQIVACGIVGLFLSWISVHYQWYPGLSIVLLSWRNDQMDNSEYIVSFGEFWELVASAIYMQPGQLEACMLHCACFMSVPASFTFCNWLCGINIKDFNALSLWQKV